MTEAVHIPTENATRDLWRLLNRFSYPTNISRYLQDKGLQYSQALVQFVAGSFSQSEAYFSAAGSSPLDISPLLLYYGAVSLLAGAAALTKGEKLPIDGHGMALIAPGTGRIASAQVVPRGNGALQQFTDVFSPGCAFANSVPWTLLEILGSVPDLAQDFLDCYEDGDPYTLAIEVVKTDQGWVERLAKKEFTRFGTPDDALTRIESLAESYLAPQITNEYVVLRRKLNSPDIGIYSLFNQKHLQLAHVMNGRTTTPGQIPVMLMGMFSLGFMSRYHPGLWNPFVRHDETGELLLIEKFVAVCHRYFPNLVLNEVSGSRMHFVSNTAQTLGPSGPVPRGKPQAGTTRLTCRGVDGGGIL